MITPLLTDHPPQGRTAEGFDPSAFRIDWAARQIRCPRGRTSAGWRPVQHHGHRAIVSEQVVQGVQCDRGHREARCLPAGAAD